MGSKRDATRRQNKREDTSVVQTTIEKAREWIFERGYRIKSKMVDRLLEPLSLLPTRVSSCSLNF